MPGGEEDSSMLSTLFSPMFSERKSKVKRRRLMECSGNGKCSKYGQCDCKDGWTGESCSTLKYTFDCHGRGKCVPRLDLMNTMNHGKYHQRTFYTGSFELSKNYSCRQVSKSLIFFWKAQRSLCKKSEYYYVLDFGHLTTKSG